MPSESTAIVWLGWIVNASIAKNAQAIAASVAASPSMLSSRLNAFVIPTSQTTPSAVAAMSLEMISTRTPDGEHERRGGALRRELRERREPEDVVEQAGDEEDRAAADDAAELAARGDQRRARARRRRRRAGRR